MAVFSLTEHRFFIWCFITSVFIMTFYIIGPLTIYKATKSLRLDAFMTSWKYIPF